MRTPRVVVSVGGRFHAFDLASQLEKRGALQRLITSYPSFKAAEWGIPADKISSLVSHELLNRAWHRLPAAARRVYDMRFRLVERFDRLAARRIPEGADVFVGWACLSLHSIRRAKGLGAMTIVERGSSHILYQREVLSEESARTGIPLELPHPAIVEKELAEYAEADYIAVPSSYAKRTFLERGIPERKLIQNPYGVELSAFRPVPKRDEVFRVIHCGGITLQKGVHYLLQAFYELDLDNAELCLVGRVNPEMQPYLKRYARPNIHVRGPYPQSELYREYSQGSVLCHASLQEGLALVIPQAMACGLPVICTENTGGEDLVREDSDGFIVPIRDIEALKEKIAFLYENREICREMGRRARQRVTAGFSWDDYGERAVNAYAAALEHPVVMAGRA